MVKRILLSIFAGIVIGTSAIVYALESLPPLVDDFMTAFKAKDETAVHKAWIRIATDEETVVYMQKNLPDHYALFKLHEVKYNLEQISRNHSPSLPPDTGPEAKGSLVGAGRDGSISNGDISRDSANQFRVTNSLIGRTFSNQNRTLNQDIVRHSSNQQVSSNQDRIRARRRR